MKLNVLERILLSQILPAQGSFTNLKLLRVVKEELSFSDKENKKLNFKQDGERMLWNNVELEKEMAFGEVASKLIKDELLKLDKEEKLTEQHMSLYEKFIEKEQIK